jgi:hypothetical protein
MDSVIKALTSLISDIESMQSKRGPNWYGGFSEYIELEDYSAFEGSVSIEWPNLAISVDDAKKALAEYEAAQELKRQLRIKLLESETLINQTKSSIVQRLADDNGSTGGRHPFGRRSG